MSVISVTCCMCLVYKLRSSYFRIPGPGIHCLRMCHWILIFPLLYIVEINFLIFLNLFFGRSVVITISFSLILLEKKFCSWII